MCLHKINRQKKTLDVLHTCRANTSSQIVRLRHRDMYKYTLTPVPYVYRNNDGFPSESPHEYIQTPEWIEGFWEKQSNQNRLGWNKGVWLSRCFMSYHRAAVPQAIYFYQFLILSSVASSLELWEKWTGWAASVCDVVHGFLYAYHKESTTRV